jgi:type 1 glutamine amidotransferase
MLRIRTLLGAALVCGQLAAQDQWVVYEGRQGPGRGKHIVFVVGDQEYRCEESMPQLAKILASQHGFRTTVLLPINRATGEIDPMTMDNIPGLENLAKADLMVIFTRFLELPDEQMKHILDYTNSGKPIVGLRTATHAFNYRTRKESAYAKYSYNSKDPQGGWGRMVLGETWINHYGAHEKESTRGLIAEGMEKHPILRGVAGIWGPSDVYGITTLPEDARPLVMGQVLSGMKPEDPPNPDKKLVPVAWTRSFTGASGKTARVFTTTMGHAGDLQNEGVRRMLVNACYWALGMEKKIPARSKADLVGTYAPNPIHMKKHKAGLKPADLGGLK